MSQVINSRALTGEKPCIIKAIHALLIHGYATLNMIIPGPQICCLTRCVLPGPRTSIVRGNCVRETSVKRRNKVVQEITRNVANVFSFYAIIAIEHASGLGFQHLPRDLANINAWKTMFDPYIETHNHKLCDESNWHNGVLKPEHKKIINRTVWTRPQIKIHHKGYANSLRWTYFKLAAM